MMKPSCSCLVLVVMLATTHLTNANSSDTDARAEACATACRDVMHWDICARENQCNRLVGEARVFCMDNCLYLGVNCEFSCWDSYDTIMATCNGQCSAEDANVAECRKRCFLREYQNQNR